MLCSCVNIRICIRIDVLQMSNTDEYNKLNSFIAKKMTLLVHHITKMSLIIRVIIFFLIWLEMAYSRLFGVFLGGFVPINEEHH